MSLSDVLAGNFRRINIVCQCHCGRGKAAEPNNSSSEDGTKVKAIMSSRPAPKPVRSHHLIALMLLAAFVAQCSWFIASVPLSQLEADQVARGIAQLRRVALAV